MPSPATIPKKSIDSSKVFEILSQFIFFAIGTKS